MSTVNLVIAHPPLLVKFGNFLFRYRNALFPALMLPLLAILPPDSPWGSTGCGLTWLALAVGLFGEGIRALVVGLAYIKRGGLNKQVYASDLVVEGMFAHCRNPLYVGNLLMILSLLLLHNNQWGYVLGGGFFLLAYIALVAAEETYLYGKFGADFADYCQRVNRWWPNFQDLGKTLAGMSFNWRRVLLKEYSSFYWWCLVVLAILANKTWHGQLAPSPITLLMVLVGVTAAFLSVWVLKKKRILKEKPV